MNQRITTLPAITAAQAAVVDLLPLDDLSVPQLKAITIGELQKVTAPYGIDQGVANAYAVNLAPAPAAYAEGLGLLFKAASQNTGAATLNVNGLGAKTIKKQGSSDLASADIHAGQIVHVVYDGTNFQIV